nr:transposase [Sorangium cellulosum]
MGGRLAAHDREGRERLFRYGARPPFALERFSELADGRIAYRLKGPNRRGAPRTHSPPRAPGRRSTHASHGPRCSRAPLRSTSCERKA